MSDNKASNFNIWTCDAYKGECMCPTPPCHFFVISSQTSSTSIDSSNSMTVWKCKYKALDAEHTNTYTWKTKRWGFGVQKLSFVHTIICIFSVAEILIGQVLKQTVDMFQRDDWREWLPKWVAWTWRNSAISWVSHYLHLGNYLPSVSEDAVWS